MVSIDGYGVAGGSEDSAWVQQWYRNCYAEAMLKNRRAAVEFFEPRKLSLHILVGWTFRSFSEKDWDSLRKAGHCEPGLRA